MPVTEMPTHPPLFTDPPVPPGPSAPADEPGTPDRPDRSGAVWVAAAGALLLFASAATFVAVRWDQLESWHKFAALVAVTQVLLIGGWLGRQRVPATASAAFSLGAVLVPLDGWTIAASGGGSWQRGLFACGVIATSGLPAARRLIDSIALRWAWLAAVPLLIAGSSAFLGPVPSGVMVAAAGLGALALGRAQEGMAWMVVGAVAPLAISAEPFMPLGRGVLHDLGMAGPLMPWATWLTAALLVAAMALYGRRIGRADVVAVAGSLIVLDVVGALAVSDVGADGWWFSAASLFLALELSTLATRSDHFWAPLLRPVVDVAEGVVGLVLPVLGLCWAGLAVTSRNQPTVALSLAATAAALGWMAADVRRGLDRGRIGWTATLTGDRSMAAGWAVAGYSVIAVLTLPVPRTLTAALLTSGGALLLLSRRSSGAVTGPVILLAATLAALPEQPIDTLVMLLALGAIALGVRLQGEPIAVVLMSTALGFGSLAAFAVAILDPDRWFADLVGEGFVAITGVAIALLLGSLAASPMQSVGGVGPWSIAALAAWTVHETDYSPAVVAAITTGVTLWFLAEAVVRRSGVAVVLTVATGPAASLGALRLFGLAAPQLAVGLAVVAIVVVGISIAMHRRANVPMLSGAGAHLATAFLVALPSPGALGVVLTITGLLALSVSVLMRSPVIAANGVIVALLGMWQTLAGYDVSVAEAYLAPLALVLLLAGVHARATHRVSSWVAYAPSVIVLGVPAFALRVAGEPGWHGLLAGAVAVVAVVVGASRRLAGPTVIGSGLLAAVTLHETLQRTAGVPTWIWLAFGGTTLLASGAVMEWSGLGPVESGRRVVELVADRFD